MDQRFFDQRRLDSQKIKNDTSGPLELPQSRFTERGLTKSFIRDLSEGFVSYLTKDQPLDLDVENIGDDDEGFTFGEADFANEIDLDRAIGADNSEYLEILANDKTQKDHLTLKIKPTLSVSTTDSLDVQFTKKATLDTPSKNADVFSADLKSTETEEESLGPLQQSEIEARRELYRLREKIARQGESNIELERTVRELDQKIGLLVSHRTTIEGIDKCLIEGSAAMPEGKMKVGKTAELYGKMFFLLRNDPKYIAVLSHALSTSEMDDFLHTVMFTLYGNHKESIEEHLLLKIFAESLEIEFSRNTEVGGLLRSNTAMSRMMTMFTRRDAGQVYLKEVLGPEITRLLEISDVELEVDPVKIYTEMVKEDPNLAALGQLSVEEIMRNVKVKRKIAERSVCLREILLKFLFAIIDSLEKVPYGVRWLCKTIQTLAKKQFPDAPESTFVSLIGGFFLLRYVNPAIVSPEAHGLINVKPTPLARRNLTLVAKQLQTLGNCSASALHKGAVDDTLKEFLLENETYLRHFFMDLCEVDDFFDELKIEEFSSLAQIERILPITLNEVYTVHRVIENHIKQLGGSFQSMLDILGALGPAPEVISRKENVLINLELISMPKPMVRVFSIASPSAPPVKKVKCVEKIKVEVEKTKEILASMEHNYQYLLSKLTAYESYLENVRVQTFDMNTSKAGVASIDLTALEEPKKTKPSTPIAFRLTKLDKEQLVVYTHPQLIPAVGDSQRGNIMVSFTMTVPGYIAMSISEKGKPPVFQRITKIEELLEILADKNGVIELGSFMKLNGRKLMVLLDYSIFQKRTNSLLSAI